MYTHFRNLKSHFERGGWRGGAFWFSKQIHRKLPRQIQGNNVFDSEWDLLVILDGCRPEWIMNVGRSWEAPGKVEERVSVGSHSREWIENSFDKEHRSVWEQTAYITANLHIEAGPFSDLAAFRPLGETHFVDELNTVPAHHVTNAAIEVGREQSPSRLIAHYLQPHVPFIIKGEDRTDIGLHEMSTHDEDTFWRFIKGEISREEIESLFLMNLKYVLKEVDLLLENFDADKVVITADHGSAFGSRFLYQHPIYVRSENVRRVPWIETKATDSETLTKVDTQPVSGSEMSKEERLTALGYR